MYAFENAGRRLQARLGVTVLLLLVLMPGAAGAQQVTRGPYLQMGTPASVVVRWRTDVATNGRVRFGTDPANLSQNADVATVTTEHEVRLTGLTPETRYYYSVGSSTAALSGGDANTFFETSPTAGTARPTRIWVLGDSGTANASQAAVRDAYLNYTGATHTDLWLMLGDNAYVDGTDAQYQAAVFNMYPGMLKRSVVWPTLGNHDGHTADSATQSGPYYDIFTLPKAAEAGGVASGTEAYYSFDHGNIHFIVLDSYETDRSVAGDMASWLRADLQATTADWVVAVWHHPPYSKGSHNSDTEANLVQMRENVVPILEDHGVDLVLCGHSHSYERSKLIDGHYGTSSTFSALTHVVQAGSGRVGETGAYTKAGTNLAHAGAVFAVAGSSGKTSGGTLNHPAMYLSLNELGSMVLDVNGLTLDAKFLNSNGTVRDYFTIAKGASTPGPQGSVSGIAWVDANRDGIRAAGEAVLSGVTVELRNGAGALVASRTTATDGRFGFTALASGDYTVRFAMSGYVFSPQEIGTDDTIDSDPSPTTGTTAVFTLLDGQAKANVDAGLYQTAPPPSTTVTVELRDGLNGYAGTQDTYLASGKAATSYGAATALLADGSDGTNGRLVTLIKWNVSSLPATATVQSAEVQLSVFNVSGGTYELRAINVPWSETTATWNSVNPVNNLGTVVGTIIPNATGRRVISLNAAGVSLLQGWVNGTAANNGLVLIDRATSDGVDARSSEYGTATARPSLKITYRQ